MFQFFTFIPYARDHGPIKCDNEESKWKRIYVDEIQGVESNNILFDIVNGANYAFKTETFKTIIDFAGIKTSNVRLSWWELNISKMCVFFFIKSISSVYTERKCM